jgi:lauroyl/myristoyl acyltransferase
LTPFCIRARQPSLEEFVKSPLPPIRRSLTHLAVRAVCRATPVLSVRSLDRLGAAVGVAGSMLWPLRRRLQANLRLALGADRVPEGTVEEYFQQFGAWAGWTLSVLHERRGPAELDFTCDESVVRLEAAARRGRGVVLTAPHFFGQDMAAGFVAQLIGRPIVAVVRESANASRQATKERWYRCLGLDTITLKRNSSRAAELKACLAALQQGKIVGITPDLISLETRPRLVDFFGRPVPVKSGAIALGVLSGAPVVASGATWCRITRRLVLHFGEPEDVGASRGKRRAAREDSIRTSTQRWFTRFEAHLRQHPSTWMFWLDKRWTQVIRSTPARVAA